MAILLVGYSSATSKTCCCSADETWLQAPRNAVQSRASTVAQSTPHRHLAGVQLGQHNTMAKRTAAAAGRANPHRKASPSWTARRA